MYRKKHLRQWLSALECLSTSAIRKKIKCMERDYLPICMEDMKKRGWTQADFVFVIGDAYVDHPSFGCNHKQIA